MADPEQDTVQLHAWIDRLQQGDAEARNELIRGVARRLEKLARRMLRTFPGVRPWVETDDVLQNALVRLMRALEEVKPPTTRAFFALAAEQVRRELLDMARYFSIRPLRHAGLLEEGDEAHPGAIPEPSVHDEAPEDLDRWARFHEHVARLPVEEREVVGLLHYHGWSQQEVASLFQVTPRTVRRWWSSALVHLQELLGESS